MMFNNNEQVIVAHRGCSGVAPENTRAAFQLALNNPRISWIELDVQLSKDGIPVVIHDYKLKRTTGVSGAVKDYSFEQLAKLDNGSWFSAEFRDERIPALDHVLRDAKGRIKLNIELKTKEDLYPGLEHEVIQLIKSYSMEDEVIITSFDMNALQAVKRLAPGIRTGLIVAKASKQIEDQLLMLGADLLSIDYRYVNPQLIEKMNRRGFEVMAWTVNHRSDIEKLAVQFPTIWICTNYPEHICN